MSGSRPALRDELQPKSHAERVAVFRAQIIGALSARDLERGELRTELEALSRTPFRLPGSAITKCYGVLHARALVLRVPSARSRSLRARPVAARLREAPHRQATRPHRRDREGAPQHTGLGDPPDASGREGAERSRARCPECESDAFATSFTLRTTAGPVAPISSTSRTSRTDVDAKRAGRWRGLSNQPRPSSSWRPWPPSSASPTSSAHARRLPFEPRATSSASSWSSLWCPWFERRCSSSPADDRGCASRRGRRASPRGRRSGRRSSSARPSAP